MAPHVNGSKKLALLLSASGARLIDKITQLISARRALGETRALRVNPRTTGHRTTEINGAVARDCLHQKIHFGAQKAIERLIRATDDGLVFIE